MDSRRGIHRIPQRTPRSLRAPIDSRGGISSSGSPPLPGGGDHELEAAAATASAAPARPDEPPVPPPPEPWEVLGEPSASGYWYFQGRSVGRVVKDKMKGGGVDVSCYRRPNCRCPTSGPCYPGDAAIKKWLFEVEASVYTPDLSKEQVKELRDQHVALGKSRWQAGLRRNNAS